MRAWFRERAWRCRGGEQRIKAEIRQEIELHLALRTQEYLEAGDDLEQARRKAERRFGDRKRVLREAVRAARTERRHTDAARWCGRPFPLPQRANPMSDLVQDFKYALRNLRHSPVFTLIALASLALGIGFNATVFTIVDAVLFKPLPFENAGRLVRLGYESKELASTRVSYPDLEDIRARAQSFDGVAAFRTEVTTFNHAGRAEFVLGESVSADLFDLLGLPPVAGRAFAPDEDDHPGGDSVVMVSEGFWRSRLGADPGAIGATLTFGGRPYTLIGVVPDRYKGATPPLRAVFWVPISMSDALAPAGTGSSRLQRRGARSFEAFARLAPHVSLAVAAEELRAIGAALAEQYPDTNKGVALSLTPAQQVRLDPTVDRVMLPAGLALMGLVGLVLLVACANLANMMLARASVRGREIAVRLAIGASRWRLVRQALSESVVLAVLGGAAAVAVTVWTLRLLQSLQPPLPIPISFDFTVAPRVLVFTGVLSALTGIAFGLLPALRSTRSDLSAAMRAEEARGSRATDGGRLRGTLVVIQVAVSLTLLIGAVLMSRSLLNANSIDPGIATDGIVGLNLGLVFQGIDPEQARTLHLQALERIQALPGVDAAAFAERLPLESTTQIDREVWLPDRPLLEGQEPPAFMSAAVTPQYFDIFHIGMVRGRAFTDTDIAGAPGVVILNQVAAERLWPGQDPIGKRLSVVGPDGPFLEVVGIHTPHKIRTLGEEPTPHLLLPYHQFVGLGFGTLVAHTTISPAATLDAMRHIATELRPGLAVMDARTIDQQLSLSLFPLRLAAVGLAVLGALGGFLAALGVYGVVAFAVARRTHEIGVRLAIGAEPGAVVRMVLRQGMKLVLVGAVIGTAAGAALGRLLSSMLYGMSPVDLPAFTIALLMLLGAAMVANLVPAMRAAHVDPVAALRTE